VALPNGTTLENLNLPANFTLDAGVLQQVVAGYLDGYLAEFASQYAGALLKMASPVFLSAGVPAHFLGAEKPLGQGGIALFESLFKAEFDKMMAAAAVAAANSSTANNNKSG